MNSWGSYDPAMASDFVKQEEQWRSVPEYEGLYEVSNFGRVRTLGRQYYANKVLMTVETKLLKLIQTTNGYLQVTLNKDGAKKQIGVHRVVALAFLPNPNGLPQVHHKDGNKQNNHLDNLQWVTAKENCNDPRRVEKFLGKNNHYFGKRHPPEVRKAMSEWHQAHLRCGGKNPAAVRVRNKDTGEVFDTVTAAGLSVGVSDNSIRNSIRRNGKSGGCCWEYVNE